MSKTVEIFPWGKDPIMFLDATDWQMPPGILHVMRAGDPKIYSYPTTSLDHWETLPAPATAGAAASAGPIA